ncbi:MAG: bifunctional oligoribonuclease/PAP phosphatase NrnA [Phycisphaerae bacterium]|nr:bifunctional oligoribonuclease/PAP phosphatase NrnA [Phycisphaerae bacterium]
MSITDDFKKAVDLLNAKKSWLITSHTRPDGDAVGSIKALCETAKQFSKTAQPILLSPPARWYNNLFSPPVPVLGNDIKIEDLQTDKYDLVIIVDTNSYVQLPEFDKWLKASKIPVLVIDHHVTGDGLGDVEIIDDTAAATGEIVYDLLKFAKWQITPVIAEALFIAISTDTGWFRFDNTDSRVLRNASALIELGAKPSAVYHEMFQNYSPERLKLLAKMLSKIELYHDGKIVLQSVSRADFDQTGATGPDTEDFVNESQRISTVEAAALFVELKDGGFRCSLRSNGSVDVQKIAKDLGGGGHKVASGVNLKGPLEEAKKLILEKIEKQLSKK